jgi:hypothetical protein
MEGMGLRHLDIVAVFCRVVDGDYVRGTADVADSGMGCATGVSCVTSRHATLRIRNFL